MVKYVKGQSPLISDLEGDVNVESDCDGDTPEGENELANTKEETRAVLITGSFSAYVRFGLTSLFRKNIVFFSFSWKSLFFYRCTNTISFAPLKSQGVDFRLNYIRIGAVTTTPPPCSPKSIYVLAKLVK